MTKLIQSVILFIVAFSFSRATSAQESVQQWGRYEASFRYTCTGNAFTDVQLSARFSNADTCIVVTGFYDGNDTFRVRFMPPKMGRWNYLTASNISSLNKQKGAFVCVAADVNNHGPVRVHKNYHFAYADGTAYYPFGTTCYSFVHQNDAFSEVAMKQMENSPFNKVRFCILPQAQEYAEVNPPYLPFSKGVATKRGNDTLKWDFSKLNPDFFKNIERRIDQLAAMGVEADVILFHPYDEGVWGFDKMPHETDLLYLRYVVARLASFRNVWWSLANEYDFMKAKSLSDWDSFITTIAQNDPYKHLCSIHNGKRYYENWNPNLTHASIQNGGLVEDFGRAVILRDAWKKPVVYDEVCYEGDIVPRWGNLSGEELVHRCWQGIVAGTYVGHGESLIGSDSILHLIYGRELRGKAPARIQFLKKFVEANGLFEPVDKFWKAYNVANSEKGNVLVYLGKNQSSVWPFRLTRDLKVPDGTKYEVDIVDTWNMTITPTGKIFQTLLKDGMIYDVGGQEILIPDRPYLAIWLRKVNF